MVGNTITGDELEQFKHIAVKKKVDSMELYLIGSNEYKYNMQDVGAKVFGDKNYSYTVSLIHRCYNFEGQNSRKYCNGCKFEQTYGYQVSRKDIEAFVKKYPNGTFNNGVTFEEFLKERVSSTQNASKVTNKKQRQQAPSHNNQIQRMSQQRFNYRNTESNNDSDSDAQVKRYLLLSGVFGAVILVLMVISGYIFGHFKLALIFLIYTICALKFAKKL